jgi:predicted DNA-binding protein (UPF0251 family)
MAKKQTVAQARKRFAYLLDSLIAHFENEKGEELWRDIRHRIDELADLADRLGAPAAPLTLASGPDDSIGLIVTEPEPLPRHDPRTGFSPYVRQSMDAIFPDGQTHNLNAKLRSRTTKHLRQWKAWASHAPGRSKPTKRQRARNPKPLTAKQLEVVQTVGECEGNIAEAARRLGKDRKTVDEAYKAACEKIGMAAPSAKKTIRLAQDMRGQETIASNDDGPASIGPKPRNISRDRRLD